MWIGANISLSVVGTLVIWISIRFAGVLIVDCFFLFFIRNTSYKQAPTFQSLLTYRYWYGDKVHVYDSFDIYGRERLQR